MAGRKSFLKKGTVETGGYLGAGVAARVGTYVALGYAVASEVYSILSGYGIRPLQEVGTESLAIIGSSALIGRLGGRYIARKGYDITRGIWNLFAALFE